ASGVSSASTRATRSFHCASVGKPSAPSAPGSPLSPFAPFAPALPGVPGSPLSPFAPSAPGSPLSPLSPLAALGAPAASIRFSSAAVIGVPPSDPSAHLSGSKAIRHHLHSGIDSRPETLSHRATSVSLSVLGLTVDLHERLGIRDVEPVLSLSADSDEVVLPQRGQLAVEGDGRLSRNVVGDAANNTPNSLRPVARVAEHVARADLVLVHGLATEQLPALQRSVVVHGIHEQRTALQINGSVEDRLGGGVESETCQLLLVVHQEGQRGVNVAVNAALSVGRGAEGDGLGGRVNVLTNTEGGVGAVQGSGVERDSERLSDLLTEQGNIVARVRANNLSRDHGDSRDLVRLDRLERETARGGRLLTGLGHPRSGRLRGHIRNLLPVDPEGNLTGERLDGRDPSGLLEIVLRPLRGQESSELAGVGCSSLSHRYLLESMGDQAIPRAFFKADSMPSPLRASAG